MTGSKTKTIDQGASGAMRVKESSTKKTEGNSGMAIKNRKKVSLNLFSHFP